MLYSCPADEHHRKHQKPHTNRYRHIRFENYENASRKPYDQNRNNAAERIHFAVIFRHIACRKNNKRKLTYFARLQSEKRKIYPPARAVIFHSDPGYKYEHKQYVRHGKNYITYLAQKIIVDKRKREHCHKTQYRAYHLLEHIIVLVAVCYFRAVRACGINHKYSEPDERDGDNEKRQIYFVSFIGH